MRGILRWDFLFLFLQMYLTWGLSTWALASGAPSPHIQSHSPLYVSKNRSLTATAQNKASAHSLVFIETHISGTERRALFRTTSVQYFNNRSHGQNTRSTPGHVEPIEQYFFIISTIDQSFQIEATRAGHRTRIGLVKKTKLFCRILECPTPSSPPLDSLHRGKKYYERGKGGSH
jgi:hypothetical protein